MFVPQKHGYIGFKTSSPSMERILSEKLSSSSSSSSSFSSSSIEQSTNKTSTALNLKATELRLGLPGSHSPDRKPHPLPSGVSLFGKDSNGYPLGSLKNFVSGAKRGFSDAIDGLSGKWVLSVGDGSELELGKGGTLFASKGESGNSQKGCVPVKKEPATGVVSQCLNSAQEETKQVSGAHQNTVAPAAKAQVVGWPPIRSFRKNTMASSNLAKNNENGGEKTGYGCLYVKVSMDGAPYLRKVDLKTYTNYLELLSGLKKMFSCFTIGQCGSQGLAGREGLNETSLKDLLHGAEYVLTYKDKDGDWMLVGDVPWVMFTETCRRLRIMKGSEAAGLAPRAMEKSKYCT